MLSGDIRQCLETFLIVVTVGVDALGTSGEKARLLLKALHCTGQPPTTKTDPVQNINSGSVEKPWSRELGSKMRKNRHGKIQKPITLKSSRIFSV